METGPSQNSLAQQVPLERLQVPDVKDDAVPLWNRSLVEKLRLNVIEQPVRLGARLVETCEQFMRDLKSVLRGEHCSLLTDDSDTSAESQTIEMIERPESCSLLRTT